MTAANMDFAELSADSADVLTPEGKRERAARLRGDAKTRRRSAYDTARLADQLDYEAALADAADAAEDAYLAARDLLPGLEAAEEGASEVMRAAQRRARSDAAAVTRYARAEDRLERERAGIDGQAAAAAATAKARAVAARSAAERDQAAAGHERAVRALDEAHARADGLRVAAENAAIAAASPGQAPRTSPLPPGVAGIGDLTGDERQLIGALALLASMSMGQAPAPEPVSPLRDKTKFRAIPGRGGTRIVVPPAMSP